MPVRSRGPFPEFSLPDLAGTVRPLSQVWTRGSALVLIGHSDCRTTRDMLPWLERIHRKGRPGSVLAVLQDRADAARRLVVDLGLTLPVRLEPDPYPLAEVLEVGVVPTLFAVDPSGEIATVSEGLRRSALEALAVRQGVEGPLFGPQDAVPELRPG
jgi:hypothetical protein